MEIRARTLLPLAVMVVAAACGGDDNSNSDSAPTTTGQPSVTTTSTTVPAGPPIDWANIGTYELGGGFTLRDEEGDAPIFAIYRSDDPIGIVEINRFPKESESLEEHVEKFHAALEADRKDGCGSDYDYTRLDPSFSRGPDGDFAHYGFTGAKPGERVTETTLQWATFQGGELVILNVAAYDEGGCVGTEGAELTVADLNQVRPLLKAAIERSPFPRPS